MGYVLGSYPPRPQLGLSPFIALRKVSTAIQAKKAAPPVVKVAPVSPFPFSALHPLLKPTLPIPAQPLLPKTAVDVVNKVTPLVSVATGSPAPAIIPPIVQAATKPPTVKIAVSTTQPGESLTPSPSASGSGGGSGAGTTGATIYNPDGSIPNVSQADVTGSPSNVMDQLKKLPPAALVVAVIGAAVLFSRR